MSPLFKLCCLHDYFASGLCAPLSLRPTAACAQQLARYQLLFRQERGGASVYYAPGASPLAQFRETEPLDFWLISSDPAFMSYTDSTPDQSHDLFYFDNLHGGDTRLNPPGPLVRAVDRPTPVPAAPPAGAWGMVAIYPGGALQAVPAAARVIDAQGLVSVKTYTLQFQAPALPWRYHLTGKSGMDFGQYEVVITCKSGETVQCDGAAEAPLNGPPGYCFVSQQPLPLRERPAEVFGAQFRPRPGTRPGPTRRLPYPEPRNLSAIEQGRRYADIYVYL